MIIMDTHIWLWWINEDFDILGQARNDLIQSEEMVAVSAISCFEVAWLDAHNRIQLPCKRTNWFEKALEGSDINLLPITPAIENNGVRLSLLWLLEKLSIDISVILYILKYIYIQEV